MSNKRNVWHIVKWVGLLLLSFLPLVIYTLTTIWSLSQGEPYFCAHGHEDACWHPESYDFEKTASNVFCLALQPIGGALSILVSVVLLVWCIGRYRRIWKTGSAARRAVLVFGIVASAVQLVFMIGVFHDYLADPVIFWYLRLRHGYYFGGARIYRVLYEAFVYAAFFALIASGLHFTVLVSMGNKHSFKDYMKKMRQILIALSPMLCYAVLHIIATATGLPYNASCCTIIKPDPSEFTINWFMVWELGGAIMAFVLSAILGYRALCSYRKNKGTSESVINLFCLVLLIGEVLALLRLLMAVWNPEMGQGRYRAEYFGYEWDRIDLPTLIAHAGWPALVIYFKRWAEWEIFAWIVLPAATMVGVLGGVHRLKSGRTKKK